MSETRELRPVFDRRASYYGKAVIVESNETDELRSYGSLVAAISSDQIARVFSVPSATTLRHIKEFLLQNGFKAVSRKQIEADYM